MGKVQHDPFYAVNIVKYELLTHFVITHENYAPFCGYRIWNILQYPENKVLATKAPFNRLQITIVAFLWYYTHLHAEY